VMGGCWGSGPLARCECARAFIVRPGSVNGPSDLIRHDTLEILANGVTVVASILAIMIVRSVVALQERAVAPPVLGPLPPMPIAGVLVPEMPASASRVALGNRSRGATGPNQVLWWSDHTNRGRSGSPDRSRRRSHTRLSIPRFRPEEEGPGGARLEFVHLLPVRPEPM
jgi:hypothetical protein